MTAAVLTPYDQVAFNLLRGWIEPDEAFREVRADYPQHTEREMTAQLLLHANALLAKGVRP